MEALAFIKKYKKIEIAPNRFNGNKEAVAYVKKLYKLGCLNVDIIWFDGVDDGENEDGSDVADQIEITLPKNISKRLDICAFLLEDRPDEVTPAVDSGKIVDWKKDNKIVFWWD